MGNRMCRWPVAAIFTACFAWGCGGDNVVPVSGVLLHKGKPVPDTRVNFYPDEGRPVSGVTDGQGLFKLRYDAKRDGVEIGNHKVVLEFAPTKTPEPGITPTPPAEFKTLYEKYSYANSKHKVKVESSTRELKLDLD